MQYFQCSDSLNWFIRNERGNFIAGPFATWGLLMKWYKKQLTDGAFKSKK